MLSPFASPAPRAGVRLRQLSDPWQPHRASARPHLRAPRDLCRTGRKWLARKMTARSGWMSQPRPQRPGPGLKQARLIRRSTGCSNPGPELPN